VWVPPAPRRASGCPQVPTHQLQRESAGQCAPEMKFLDGEIADAAKAIAAVPLEFEPPQLSSFSLVCAHEISSTVVTTVVTIRRQRN
jgi:hypothetical protein